jgi:RND superfamily putative drug exporter
VFVRIADLTWKHPKLVLAAVGAFAVLAIAVGKDVEHHLKAAGFTDSASESEKAKNLLTDALGYNPNPGIVLVVRAPGGGPLDLRSPVVRGQVDRLSRQVSGVEDVGHVVNPLHDRRAGAELIAADGSSLVPSSTSPTATSKTGAGSSPKTSSRWPTRAASTSRWAATRPASTRSTTRPKRI